MTSQTALTTRRLRHRKLEESDSGDFIALVQLPVVCKFAFNQPSAAEAKQQFEARLPDWHANADHWLCFTIRDKHTNAFIGVTGLRHAPGAAEVGFILHPSYFGLGYGTESLQALTQYASTLGFSRLRANITEGNTASIRVVEKCGYTLVNVNKESIVLNGRSYNDFTYEKTLIDHEK